VSRKTSSNVANRFVEVAFSEIINLKCHICMVGKMHILLLRIIITSVLLQLFQTDLTNAANATAMLCEKCKEVVSMSYKK
jgi:hypothetical protein